MPGLIGVRNVATRQRLSNFLSSKKPNGGLYEYNRRNRLCRTWKRLVLKPGGGASRALSETEAKPLKREGNLCQHLIFRCKELRRVVIAASVGNIIEWYDFYIFGSLASILAVKFFEKGHPVAAFLSTVAIFSVGFLIRPLGAFVFGWLGDKVGRKYTFIVTLTGMGVATALIGFVPTYPSIGLAAAFILFVLRLIQGLCLGGEYGGAITYVAEHIEDEHRGYYTGWLQTSPTLGIVVSLATIIGIRTYLGIDAFNDWGWRLPFIISLLLVAIAIWIRLSLGRRRSSRTSRRGAAPRPTRGARRSSATTSSTW